MPKNWKYIKKLLEKEFLCEKLKKKIIYDLTDYRPAPWYQQHFIMKYGNEVLLDSSQPKFSWDKRCEPLLNGRDNEYDEESLAPSAHAKGIYGVEEIIDSIGIYLHSDIEKSLDSKEPFVAVLAFLDRRCGKRTLEKLAERDYPDWMKKILWIRLEAEGIKIIKTREAAK